MIPVGHIVSITTSATNSQVVPTLLKIAGRGQMFLGSTTEHVSNHLYIIRESKKSTHELTAQLQVVPGFNKVAIVALSKPINESELSKVRELFAGLDWDTSSVTDDELFLFIDDKLLGQYTYYIDLERKKNERGAITMRIKRLEDHPQFSPDWLINSGAKKGEIQGWEQPFDEIVTHEYGIEMEAKEEPPPPPPAPTNLKQLTDIQIRDWIRKNYTRNLNTEDIEIKRSYEKILITIMVDGGVETVIYKLTT